VLGGKLTATFLAIFFIPLFYVFVVQIFGRDARKRWTEPAAAAAVHSSGGL
jgi:hypothetical protein